MSDWYDAGYYKSSPSSNPTGASGGSYRVLRGGSWNRDPEGLRVSNRARDFPTDADDDGGFRCVRD